METPTEKTQNEDLSSRDNGQESKTVEKDPIEALMKELDQLRAENIQKSIEVEAQKKKLETYESKIDGIRNYVKKIEGEIEAVRTRAEKEQERILQKKFKGFITPFLEIMDNFERSLSSAADPKDSFYQGVHMIYKQMQESLQQMGVSRILSKDEVFDPEVHEAISTVDVDSDAQDSVIQEELKAGYMFGNELICPAQVIVGKKK